MSTRLHPSSPDAQWRKSSYSNGSGGECVEVADLAREVTAVRDSKDPDGTALTFSRGAWGLFIASVKGHRLR